MCNVDLAMLLRGDFVEGEGLTEFDDDTTFTQKYLTTTKTMFFADDRLQLFFKQGGTAENLHDVPYFSGRIDWAAERFSAELNTLKFHPSIMDRLISLPQNTVGLHIRTHDLAIPPQHIINVFRARIDTLLAEEPATQFFLATDTAAAYSELIDAYPSSLVAYPFERFDPTPGSREFRPGRWRMSPSRNCAQGIVEATVDLLTLARTKNILRTRNSSFSWLATMWNLTPAETLFERVDADDVLPGDRKTDS